MNTTPETSNSAAVEEAIRTLNLKTEASLKSVGYLYYISAVVTLVIAIRDFTRSFELQTHSILLVLLAGVIALVGFGFRKLDEWAVVPGTILSVLGLLSFPVGTLINGYILYLLYSPGGKTVFSPEYKKTIVATPHIVYKTPKSSWIILGSLVAVLALFVVFVLLR